MRRSIHALERIGNRHVDVPHGSQHALSLVAAAVAIAQLNSFVLARRGAAGNGSPAYGTVTQGNLRFHGGVSAGIKDFTCVDIDNAGVH